MRGPLAMFLGPLVMQFLEPRRDRLGIFSTRGSLTPLFDSFGTFEVDGFQGLRLLPRSSGPSLFSAFDFLTLSAGAGATWGFPKVGDPDIVPEIVGSLS